MFKQIVRLSVHQTSKVIALIHFLISIIVIVPITLFLYYLSQDPQFFVYLIFPFLNLLFSYILAVIFCWIYNLVARGFGGIEIELNDPKAHLGTESKTETH